MSGSIADEVWGLRLSRTERQVLLALAGHAHDDGTHSYPSVGLLAWKTDLSERQVQRAIRDLLQKGILQIERPARGGRGEAGLPTMYSIHIERGEKKPTYIRKIKGDAHVTDYEQEKGDISEQRVTPMSPNTNKRVTFLYGKGDISEEKGDTQMSPEPSERTVRIEPSERMDGEREYTTAPARDGISFLRAERSSGPPARAAPPGEASATRPTTIPSDFDVRPTMKAWAERKATEYGVSLNVALLADKFLNYYRQGRGKRTVQHDWIGCWQDWVIRDIEELEQKGKANGQHGHARNGQHGVAAPGESKRALAVKQRWRERTGTELDEVSFDGVADPPPDHRGRPGSRRELPPDSS